MRLFNYRSGKHVVDLNSRISAATIKCLPLLNEEEEICYGGVNDVLTNITKITYYNITSGYLNKMRYLTSINSNWINGII